MQKRDEIVQLIKRVSFEEGLTVGSSASLRYERNFGSGVEEFVRDQAAAIASSQRHHADKDVFTALTVQIEAISFQHFLTHGTLVTLDEVQDLFRIKGLDGAPETVQGPEGNPVEIPHDFVSM